MTVKEFLCGIRDNDKRIKALMERRQQYYDMAMRGTGSMEAERVSGTSQRSRVEDAVCKLVDLDAELDREIDRLTDEIQRAEYLISQLPDKRHQDVLRYRYLNGWSWEKIEEVMRYDRRWMFRLHGEGLQAISNISCDLC